MPAGDGREGVPLAGEGEFMSCRAPQVHVVLVVLFRVDATTFCR